VGCLPCAPRRSYDIGVCCIAALMNWWQTVLELQDYVAGYVEPRLGGELANSDLQNSLGAAHSRFGVLAT
jgi:hypothetical protein